jgi:hypothetical protein
LAINGRRVWAGEMDGQTLTTSFLICCRKRPACGPRLGERFAIHHNFVFLKNEPQLQIPQYRGLIFYKFCYSILGGCFCTAYLF